MKRSVQKAAVALLVIAGIFFASGEAKAACAAGDKAQVLWKGTWYPATVLKGKGSECYIHYDGYGSSWDEWVGPDRIKVAGASAPAASASKFSAGDAVQVLWKGTWYPAQVLSVVGNGSYKIHYDGYGSSWDEVVGPGRIKAR